MSELVRKVSTCVYFLRQLKEKHVAARGLILFYITCIRFNLEYSSPVFHHTRAKLSNSLRSRCLEVVGQERTGACLPLKRPFFLSLFVSSFLVVSEEWSFDILCFDLLSPITMNMTWGKLFVHPINVLLSLNRLLAAFQTIITQKISWNITTSNKINDN